MNRLYGQKEEGHMKETQKIMDQLLMIVECAGTGYQKGDKYYDYAGTKEAKSYFEEYESQVYSPFLYFDENVKFVSKKVFETCNYGKIIFNGDFVRVKWYRSALDGEQYLVYCAPLSVCKTCYRLARKEPTFPK